MNPPLTTHLALIDVALRAYVEELSAIRSCNGAVIFMRDKHYRSEAAAVVSVATDVSDKRLEFVETKVEGHRVDLTATTLGETFTSRESHLQKSRMNPAHMVWGTHIDLPRKNEAAVQLAFDKSGGALPAPAQLTKIWQQYRDDIVHSLVPLTQIDTPSLADECRVLPSVTPNAYVIKWDIANSTQSVAQNYGDFRHFMTTFMYAIRALVDYHGGLITAHTGDGQHIVVKLPATIDLNDAKAVTDFGVRVVMPLIDKIERAHETLAVSYQPTPRLNLALGLDNVEMSQHGELTGPIFWRLASKLKTLGSSGDFVNFVVDDTAKRLA